MPLRHPVSTSPSPSPAVRADDLPEPLDSPQMSLVDQLTGWARLRIDEHVFRAGMRMPSIRQLAQEKGVSRFSVVEAYERLVAQGYLEARRGSGFYVRARPGGESRPRQKHRADAGSSPLDVSWLVRSMFHSADPRFAPGLGYLPSDWLGSTLIADALRSLGRQNAAQFLASPSPQGFLPLRMLLQSRLAEIEIGAPPEQILLTTGITQAIDLLARTFLQPGDTVLVGDPGWFLMFARFAAQGARVIGVPWTREGPDAGVLAQLLAAHRPKLLFLNSVLHNPTGSSLSAARAYQVLQLAERYGVTVVEDDIYGELCPPGWPATRLASLDQLRRVIYLGSFSKTLTTNLRVGFIACPAPLARTLADTKLLIGLTTPEINERLLYKVLADGHYRRHIERLRDRVAAAREQTQRRLERLGLKMFDRGGAGMNLWADTGIDTAALAAAGQDRGYLFAPGALFSPTQMPSTWTRFNVATSGDAGVLEFLVEQMDKGGRRPAAVTREREDAVARPLV